MLTLILQEVALGIHNNIFITIVAGQLPILPAKKCKIIDCSLCWYWGIGDYYKKRNSTKTKRQSRTSPVVIFIDTIKSSFSFWSASMQIALLSIIFSFDSVLFAVGLVKQIPTWNPCRNFFYLYYDCFCGENRRFHK